MCLGLIIEMIPPHRASDVENIPSIILPPLSSDFALSKTSKSSHSDCGPDSTLTNPRRIRAIIGINDNRRMSREKLQMLFDFLKSVRRPFASMLLSFWDRHSRHRISTVIDALTLCKCEHTGKGNLDVLVRAVC